MSESVQQFQPAIDALEHDFAELERQKNTLERQAAGLIAAINILRAKAGLPPRPGLGGIVESQDYSENGSSAAGASNGSTAIRSDQFFGIRMGTAARQFLEMRRAASLGAAKPRDILDALKSGGFQFETKDDSIALISVRNMLSKRSETFIKLQNGTYGLKAWYPHAKQPKAKLDPSEPDSAKQPSPRASSEPSSTPKPNQTEASAAA